MQQRVFSIAAAALAATNANAATTDIGLGSDWPTPARQPAFAGAGIQMMTPEASGGAGTNFAIPGAVVNEAHAAPPAHNMDTEGVDPVIVDNTRAPCATPASDAAESATPLFT